MEFVRSYPNHTHIFCCNPNVSLRTRSGIISCALFSITDEYSGAFWGMYVSKFDIKTVITFMQLSMLKDDEKTFHGVPKNFVVDKNPLFANQNFGRFVASLAIRIIASQQTAAQKGIAERTIAQLQKFTTQFKGSSLEEINQGLAKLTLAFNDRTARTATWNKITADQLVVYGNVAEVNHG